jgi:20S proteasome subunit beta 4
VFLLALNTALVRLDAVLAGSYFALSLFDKMWHPDLSEDEAVAMMEAGIAEIKKRLVVAPPHYLIKVVDKDGVREVKKV